MGHATCHDGSPVDHAHVHDRRTGIQLPTSPEDHRDAFF